MKNIYEEFEKIVKERGEWIEKFLPGIIGSAWKVGNFIVIFDETACLSEEKIVAVIETNEKIFYVLYISQSVFKNGIEELKKLWGLSEIITGEEIGGISSKERLMMILEKIQNCQPKTGFFINRALFDFFNFFVIIIFRREIV